MIKMKTIRLYIIAALSLSILCLCQKLSAEEDWVEFASDEAHEGLITVSLPGEPEFEQRTISTILGDIVTNIYGVDSDSGSFRVGFARIPHGILDEMKREDIYDVAKATYLQNSFGIESQYSEFVVEKTGLIGKELLFGCPGSGVEHPGFNGRAKFYLDGSLLFIGVTRVPAGKSTADSDRFFASAKFTPQEPWQSFRSSLEDESFLSIKMPSNPELKESASRTPLGSVRHHDYANREKGATFLVSYSKLPKLAVRLAGSKTIFNNARGAILSKAFAEEVSFEPADSLNPEGMELVYQTCAIGGMPSFKGSAQMYIEKGQLVILNSIVPETRPPEYSEQFFGSLSIFGS